LNNKSLDTRRI